MLLIISCCTSPLHSASAITASLHHCQDPLHSSQSLSGIIAWYLYLVQHDFVGSSYVLVNDTADSAVHDKLSVHAVVNGVLAAQSTSSNWLA